MKLDMHLHTCGSFDCLNEPHALIARAVERGIDRVCITDHNQTHVARELKRAYPQHVIIGEEVKTAERVDIIGLFLSEPIPRGTPARETCARIRAQGGIVYVPHPFAGRKGAGAILEQIEDLVDAVEGFNARIHDPRLNRRAAEWALARDLPLGAGSDAHTLREVGRAWVELPPFADDAAAFLAALRHGTIHGVLSSRAVHLASLWARTRNWLVRN